MIRRTSPRQLRAVKRYKRQHKKLARLYRYRSACRRLIKIASTDELQQIIKLAEVAQKNKLDK